MKSRHIIPIIFLFMILGVIITSIFNNDTHEEITNRQAIDTLDRKPTFSFIFDDNNISDSSVVEKFRQYNLNCGFAIIASEYFTRQQEYLNYQNEGFEILSHSIDGIGFKDGKTSLCDANMKFRQSLSKLTDWGFDVKGWVTPASEMPEKYIPLLKKYYTYGFTEYYGKPQSNPKGYHIPSDELRHLKRLSIEWKDTDSLILNEIDKTIEENGLLFFYAHKYPNEGLKEDRLELILNKLKLLSDSNKCDILPPYKAIKRYYWNE